MNPLERELRARIESQGPISVADYMAACNAHYYATRDPFGAAGDFITAPEISQMFGELIGAWLTDLWQRAGRPEGAHYVELGPGRGTLAVDALRVMRKAGLEPDIHLVETSPVLRQVQAAGLPGAVWHGEIATLPENGPLLIVANEFFDALPISQYDKSDEEVMVALVDDKFVRTGQVASEIRSECPAFEIGRRIHQQGGAALIADYGYVGPSLGEPDWLQFRSGDTLQAVSKHEFADPFSDPGSRDLTAHVDFSALAATGRDSGPRTFGPVGQGQWLDAMGISQRAEALAAAVPNRTEEIAAARDRLVAPEEMGRLFKVMALVAPGWPAPAGFAS